MRKLIVTSLLITTLMGCSKVNNTSKVFCFDTYVDIALSEGNKNNIKEIENILKKLDKLSDNYNQRDLINVFSLNKTNEEVSVDKDLYEMIKLAYKSKNEGAEYFNPLCGSLSKLWKESLIEKKIPSQEEINSELNKMSSSSLTFKDEYIIQRNGEAEIDLGGIAKGYALDKIQEYLKSEDIKSYLINGGESSILLGEKKSKDGCYTIGFRDVENAYIKVKNCFVSTSSKRTQKVVIDNVTYSHIINPKDGSAFNENDAVVVISDKGWYGDVMSTSLMMNTVDEIKQIEIDHDIKTIVIKDGKIVYHHEGIEVLKH